MQDNVELVKKFYKVMDNILHMKVKDFLDKYRDTLPKYEVIGEDTSISNIISHFENNVSYLLVVGRNRRIKGSIAYSEFLNIFGRSSTTALSAPFSSVSRSLRHSRVPLEAFSNMNASDILFSSPPCVNEDTSVREALEYMYKTGSHYVVVVNHEREIIGVITLHSIFRAIVKELKSYK